MIDKSKSFFVMKLGTVRRIFRALMQWENLQVVGGELRKSERNAILKIDAAEENEDALSGRKVLAPVPAGPGGRAEIRTAIDDAYDGIEPENGDIIYGFEGDGRQYLILENKNVTEDEIGGNGSPYSLLMERFTVNIGGTTWVAMRLADRVPKVLRATIPDPFDEDVSGLIQSLYIGSGTSSAPEFWPADNDTVILERGDGFAFRVATFTVTNENNRVVGSDGSPSVSFNLTGGSPPGTAQWRATLSHTNSTTKEDTDSSVTLPEVVDPVRHLSVMARVLLEAGDAAGTPGGIEVSLTAGGLTHDYAGLSVDVGDDKVDTVVMLKAEIPNTGRTLTVDINTVSQSGGGAATVQAVTITRYRDVLDLLFGD